MVKLRILGLQDTPVLKVILVSQAHKASQVYKVTLAHKVILV
jgi:hypothetical protein